MKTELRVSRHTINAGEMVIEIWHDGQMIGTIYGTETPGVKVISKHPTSSEFEVQDGLAVEIITIDPTLTHPMHR